VFDVRNKSTRFKECLKKRIFFLKSLIKGARFPRFNISLDIPTLIFLLSLVLVSSIFLPEIIFDLFSYAKPEAVSKSSSESVILAGGVVNPKSSSPYKAGDKKSFSSRKFSTGIKGDEYELTAVCKAVGEFCYIFLEEGQEVDSVWIDKLKTKFDEEIANKEKIKNRFTSTFDNEGRITLLLLDIKDEWSPEKKGESYIAGYFWGENLIPNFRSKTGNEAEILYLDINPAKASTNDFLETVSHEFEHLIHWSFAEVRVWLIIFLQVGLISFFVLNHFLEGRWKGKL